MSMSLTHQLFEHSVLDKESNYFYDTVTKIVTTSFTTITVWCQCQWHESCHAKKLT